MSKGEQDALGASLGCWVCLGGFGLRAGLTSIPCPRVHRQLPGDLGEDLPLHLGPLLVLVALLVRVGHVELQAEGTREALSHGPAEPLTDRSLSQTGAFQTQLSLSNTAQLGNAFTSRSWGECRGEMWLLRRQREAVSAGQPEYWEMKKWNQGSSNNLLELLLLLP